MNWLNHIILLKQGLKKVYFSSLVEYRKNHLFNCVVNNDIEEAKWLVARGADINYQDKNKDTALHYAINSYCMGLILPLLDLGADINIKNSQGTTPLMSLCKLEYEKYNQHLLVGSRHNIVSFLELMIQSGADINAIDNYYCSAISHAFSYHNSRIVKKLIDLKSNLYIKDHKGQDFIDELCHKKDYDLLTYLCQSSSTQVIEDITDRLKVMHELNKPGSYQKNEYDRFKIFLDALEIKNRQDRYETLFPEKKYGEKKKVKI